MDAILDHPATGHATVRSMRANGGRAALNISHVAYPDLKFNTPSGKIEFVSARAEDMGLPALPVAPEPNVPDDALRRGIANGDAIEISNARGVFIARAKVTRRMPEGAVWMRDGWPRFNALTDGSPVLPEAALDTFPFSVGQAEFGARVQVAKTSQGSLP